jgi:hypothetical protein
MTEDPVFKFTNMVAAPLPGSVVVDYNYNPIGLYFSTDPQSGWRGICASFNNEIPEYQATKEEDLEPRQLQALGPHPEPVPTEPYVRSPEQVVFLASDAQTCPF